MDAVFDVPQPAPARAHDDIRADGSTGLRRRGNPVCPGSRPVQPRFARNTPGHTPDTGQCTIDVDIILCDAFDREALVKARPDFGAAELRQARYRRRGSLDVINQNASNAVIDLPRAMSAELTVTEDPPTGRPLPSAPGGPANPKVQAKGPKAPKRRFRFNAPTKRNADAYQRGVFQPPRRWKPPYPVEATGEWRCRCGRSVARSPRLNRITRKALRTS